MTADYSTLLCRFLPNPPYSLLFLILPDSERSFHSGRDKGRQLLCGTTLSTVAVLLLVALSLLSSPSIQPSTGSSASSVWPMLHQNAQHTGLSPFPGPALPFLRWMFQTGGPVYSPPAVGRGRIYVGSDDGNLYALNLQGVLLWKFQTPSPIMTTPAIGSDGTIYLGGESQQGGVLYAINPAGKLKWNLTIPSLEGVGGALSPTIAPDGTLYVSDFDFQILAVSPNGTPKWNVNTYGEVWDSPALAADGTVYVGIDDPDSTGACGQCLMAINPN